MVRWYAVYVKSRCEFVSSKGLEDRGIVAYLPTIKRTSKWRDRNKLIEWPLFPGYLFVHITSHPRIMQDVLRTNGIVCILGCQDNKPIAVPDKEINDLRLLTKYGTDLEVNLNIKEGTRVRTASGPLQGAEGVIDKSLTNHCMFIVNISILSRSVAIKIPVSDVEKL